MLNRGLFRAPPVTLVLAVFFFLMLLMWRGTSGPEAPPFSFVPERDVLFVELRDLDQIPTVYQLNDGSLLCDVIKLTNRGPVSKDTVISGCLEPLCNGASYDIVEKERRISIVQRGWMPAGQRMALGVPLHPDRMDRSDWTALPGAGEKLAEKIHRDRQNNGDFGTLKALTRVNGIGPGKISRWEQFFKHD